MSLRIVVADDSAILREGLAGLLERRGHSVVGQASSAPSLEAVVDKLRDDLPDIVITDVRMPPGMGDDGLKAAVNLRNAYPGLPVMVLSQYVAPAYAVELFDSPEAGTGYLLKDRVSEVRDFLASLDVVAQGGTVVGAVRHPLATTDFSSFLLQAQASKAKVIGLANAGGDTVNAIKQAAERVSRRITAGSGAGGVFDHNLGRRHPRG